MTHKNCIKCGAAPTSIKGPKYFDGIQPHGYRDEKESLIFACGICGYTWHEPTVDSKRNPQ